jgi:hypothetical protein
LIWQLLEHVEANDFKAGIPADIERGLQTVVSAHTEIPATFLSYRQTNTYFMNSRA